MSGVLRVRPALGRYLMLGCLLGMLVIPATAGATTLRWRQAARIDRASLQGLACPSASLCVATDSAGRVLVSTDPAAGAARWRAIDPTGGAHSAVTGISCPGVRLCIAIDSAGELITSSNPTKLRSWSVARVDSGPNYNGGPLLTGISCPSRSFCVAVDGDGNAITSTRPGAGSAAWTLHQIDSGLNFECYHYGGTGPACVPGIVAVSCSSNLSCTAIDWAAGVLSTTDPAGPGTWGGGQQPASESYSELTCPSHGFCLLAQLYVGRLFLWRDGLPQPSTTLAANGAIDGIWCRSTTLCFASAAGTQTADQPTHLFESNSPAATKPHWQRVLTTPSGISAVSCPTATMCVAAEENGQFLVAKPATRRR